MIRKLFVYFILCVFAVSLIIISDPAYAICQSGYCDSGISESAEGPGGTGCCSGSGVAGYEECYDYKTKSTAYIPGTLISPSITKTDYCINSYTLREYSIDCEWARQDRMLSKDKNCNDYDNYGSYVYYCTDNQVRKHRPYYDYSCSNGACKSNGVWANDQLVSKSGDSNYCAQRKSRGCSLCGHGDYDCDWDSECSGSLKCMGPVGGAADGCCKSGETWNTATKKCEVCSSGACCSGGQYRPSSYVCDSHYGSYGYACSDGTCLGDDVYKQDRRRYCSGSSASCNGELKWNDPVVADYCGSTGFCNRASPGSNDFICKTAQCTSGECCDTDCGDYTYKPSTTKCFMWMDYGCPWGKSAGDDVGKRTANRYCTGSSSGCFGNTVYGGWSVEKDCSVTKHCEQGSGDSYYCKTITTTTTPTTSSTSTTTSVHTTTTTVPTTSTIHTTSTVHTTTTSIAGECSTDYDCKKPGCSSTDPRGCLEYCDNWDPKECSTGDVWVKRLCHDRGCSSGSCYDNTHYEAVKVEECGSDTCVNGNCVGEIECNRDSDCGTDSYVGSPWCANNDVYQRYNDYTCIDPGPLSSCRLQNPVKKRYECGSAGCSGGQCNGATTTSVNPTTTSVNPTTTTSVSPTTTTSVSPTTTTTIAPCGRQICLVSPESDSFFTYARETLRWVKSGSYKKFTLYVSPYSSGKGKKFAKVKYSTSVYTPTYKEWAKLLKRAKKYKDKYNSHTNYWYVCGKKGKSTYCSDRFSFTI